MGCVITPGLECDLFEEIYTVNYGSKALILFFGHFEQIS
jgi:hypothetical protein